MDSVTLVGLVSMLAAGLSLAIGVVGAAAAQGRAIEHALTAMAQQPDESSNLTRTLFVGLAMIESLAIYCFVLAMILVFANPFWNFVLTRAGK